MLSSTAMSKQSDGEQVTQVLLPVTPLTHPLQMLRELVELLSPRGAYKGVRKLCVRGGLSYISIGGGLYQEFSDTP